MAELIWDGKYDKEGKKQAPVRLELPFQTIETVNESVQERQRSLEMFAEGRDSGWRNRLIWGDKKYVLPSLLPEFAGKVDLIYIDPPFDTGADFSYTASIPIHGDENGTSFVKEASILEQKAYRDTWGLGIDSYLQWFYETATILHELLVEGGSAYFHLDERMSHHAKVILDEVFGRENYRNEITWKRQSAHSDSNRYGRIHDVLLFYTTGDRWEWHDIVVPYDESYAEQYYRYKDNDGRRFMSSDLSAPAHGRDAPPRMFGDKKLNPPKGRMWPAQKTLDDLIAQHKIFWTREGYPRLKQFLDESKGMPLQDIWIGIESVRSWHKEQTPYPTQKPEALVERIMKASSNEGDLTLDCFVGSGTTAAVAERLNRRWIACDLGRFAIHTTRKRLLGIPNVRPFVVQNLGKYERQAWQVAEFPSDAKHQAEEQREREAAYRKFILELYHATPISGRTWLHGVKGGRMVHVGAVDAPVTLDDVKAIAREVWKSAGKGEGAPARAAADILGWEFAFELNETARQLAAESRVEVNFKKIPREVLEKKAVDQGDIKFFELGALGVEAKQNGRELKLKLTDFVIPIDDIPAEVRKAIKHWSQMIDYWAVDWDYRNDTFHNQWQSYRTRKDPKITLESSHEYSGKGKYVVVVKVIDILGNDTTKTLQIEVK